MTTSSVQTSFCRFITSRIRNDAYDAINKIAPIVTFAELYDEFRVDVENKIHLLAIIDNDTVTFGHNYDIIIGGLDVYKPIPIHLKAILPLQYRILPVSNIFMPILKFAQEWAILEYVVEEICPFIDRNSISTVFPWIQDVIREEQFVFGGKNRNFFYKYSIGKADARKKLEVAFKAALHPSKKSVALVPSILHDAIELGNKLFTQSRLLRATERGDVPEGKLSFVPQSSDNFVPDSIRSAVNEMKEFQRSLKNKVLYGADEAE